MRRRDALAVLGGAVSSATGTAAQTRGKVPVIGILTWGSAGRDIYVEPFLQAMRELGYAEGRDVSYELHYADTDPAKAAAAARELARREVDLVVACATPAAHAAKGATATIPIVMAPVADPIATGLVESLARPGGNLTGVSTVSPSVAAKSLEALRDAIPGLRRVGFLGSTLDPNARTFVKEAEAAASGLHLSIQAFMVAVPEEFEPAFKRMLEAGIGAVLIQPIFGNEAALLAELAARHRIATASTAISPRRASARSSAMAQRPPSS